MVVSRQRVTVAKCVRISSFCHSTLHTPLRLTLLLLQPALQSKSEGCVRVVHGMLTDALMRVGTASSGALWCAVTPLPVTSVTSGVTLFRKSRQYCLYSVHSR